MHGCDRAGRLHANGVTRARKFVQYWFLYVKIIWICQRVLLFFLSYGWLPPPLVHHFLMLATSLRYADCFSLFVCFYRHQFCSSTINQISINQSKNWFSFFLLCRREKYHWTSLLGLYINNTNKISELYQHICWKIISMW